jgi:TolB protein
MKSCRDDAVRRLLLFFGVSLLALPLAASDVFVQAVAWSPNDRQLVITATVDHHSALYLADAEGKKVERITDPSVEACYGSWSPDGKRLVYAATVDGNRDLYTMSMPDKRVQRLTDDPAGDSYPSWSPDGKEIAFESKRSGTPQIWLMNANGERQHRLTSDTSNDWNPQFGPNRLIVFESNRNRAKGDSLYLIRSDGSGERRLTSHEPPDVFPTWLTDGRIAFASGENDKTIHLIHADGSGEVTTSMNGFFARWSHKRRSIAVIDGGWPTSRLVIYDRRGKQLRTISIEP